MKTICIVYLTIVCTFLCVLWVFGVADHGVMGSQQCEHYYGSSALWYVFGTYGHVGLISFILMLTGAGFAGGALVFRYKGIQSKC